jgi:predicted dehydrogenase
MINIGIAGCGRIAQVRHLPEYADRKEVKIAAVYDLKYERACEIAGQYGAKAYREFQDLLDDKTIDAVSICVANAYHCDMTVAALKAGKHVLCEKPMAVTLEQCERMVETARETGRFLMIGHNQRLARAHAKARELIVSGEIGTVITFQTNFQHSGPETWSIDSGSQVWFFDREKAAFGAMADLGIHKTDLIQFLTGQKVQEVMAYVGTLQKKDQNGCLINVDDNAVCIYQMDGGCTGIMKASWTCYGQEDNSTVLYGTEGVMHIYEDPRYSIVVEHRDKTRTLYEVDQIQTNDSQTKSGIIDQWVDCLISQRKPEISGEEALSAMKAVFAALESGKTGKKIKVK